MEITVSENFLPFFMKPIDQIDEESSDNESSFSSPDNMNRMTVLERNHSNQLNLEKEFSMTQNRNYTTVINKPIANHYN